ncbi:hypothetical protein ACFLT2_01140 [Acidobacteriota bacterium]
MSTFFRTKKTYALAILLIFILSAFVFAEKQKIKVVSEKANVHLWPDAKSQIIGRILSGTILFSKYKQGEWFMVHFRPSEGAVMKSGYIHQKDVKEAETKRKKELQIIISGKRAVVDEDIEYKGEPVSLQFTEADIRDVISVLCEFGGWSVAFDPGVKGKISCELKDVPWDQALDVILKTFRLGKTEEGKVFRIGKTADLMDKC